MSPRSGLIAKTAIVSGPILPTKTPGDDPTGGCGTDSGFQTRFS
jgi:hypothetical protein